MINLKELVDEITAHLSETTPETWYRYGHSDDNVPAFENVVADTGLAFSIELGSTGRLIIEGWYGEAWRYRKDRPAPRITISPERPPAVIAADINQRFLSAYRLDYLQASQKRTEALERENARLRLEYSVMQAWPHGHKPAIPGDTIKVGDTLTLGWYGKITVFRDESVTLELRGLSAKQVNAIGQLMRENLAK